MTLNFHATWLTAVLLCSLRLSALLFMTPILQAMGLPARVRVIFVLALSAMLVTGLQLAPVNPVGDVPALVGAGINELMLGALMAFGIFAAFAAFNFAGNALDLQIGFNIANAFDPVTRSQSPLLASLLALVAVALFFAVDAHHAVMRGFAYSLERIPLGSPMVQPDPALLIKQFGTIFSLGLMLAAPVLFVLFLLELALAVLSRNLQQMNIFFLAAPVKIAVGLIVMVATASHIGIVAEKIFNGVFTFWDAVL